MNLNPARELHNLFSEWRQQHSARTQSVGLVRGKETLESTIQALRLLDGINLYIDAWDRDGNQVSVQRRNSIIWRDSILVYKHGWQTNVSAEEAYPQASMDALDMLAQMIEMSPLGFVPPLANDKIREFVDLIRGILGEDDTLDIEFVDYMERLLESVESAMNHRNAEQLRIDLEHLWFAVFAAEEVSKEDGKWRNVFLRFTKDTFSQTIASILGGIASRMITP